MKLGDLVELKWWDHCSSPPNGWVDSKTTDFTPVVCRTVGWIVKLTPKYVTVTSTYDTASLSISGFHTRLRSDIIKSKVLKGLS